MAYKKDLAKRMGKELKREARVSATKRSQPDLRERTLAKLSEQPRLSQPELLASFLRASYHTKVHIIPIKCTREVVTMIKKNEENIHILMKWKLDVLKDMKMYCDFHKDYGHNMVQCFAFRNKIAYLLK